MFQSIGDVQKLGRENIDLFGKSFAAMSKGVQALVTDAADYTRKSFETSSAAFEKLAGAKSIDTAVAIQADYSRAAYEGFVAQSTKVGDTVTTLAQEAYKPFEGLMAKVGK